SKDSTCATSRRSADGCSADRLGNRAMTRRRAWRRARHLTAATAVALLLVAGVWLYGLRLRPTAAPSRWLVAAAVALLALFGARKKMSTIPLGRASAWLRIHVDVGLVSLALFVVHACYNRDTGFHVPSGTFEATLAAAYVATAASGLVGLALSRS